MTPLGPGSVRRGAGWRRRDDSLGLSGSLALVSSGSSKYVLSLLGCRIFVFRSGLGSLSHLGTSKLISESSLSLSKDAANETILPDFVSDDVDKGPDSDGSEIVTSVSLLSMPY